MVEIDIDGKLVSVPEGSMVMHAAEAAGTYIPHFCYHKKLSIAANCRMCLVDVEKAPKAVPACATPVTAGMVVRTQSDKALKSQRAVMEFLLINHPLDCPICDQGGECQLQDLAVGYGGSASRYQEEKRVVFHKNVGPLISMEEMSRCIHCTRCVRFGQEIAGVMELGMLHRGEHSEITTFVGQTVDSELSGNMIDICPVGALTSKPFRYSARTWELQRRRSISPHDSTGAHLVVQVKGQQVKRVVPLENEAINECWIADRDRFSYEAINSDSRLKTPRLRQNGQWVDVDWNTALEYVARSVRDIVSQHGPQALGALASPHATTEELYLLTQLVRSLGSDNIDHRLRHADARTSGVRWLGRSIASLSGLSAAWVVGSFLRKDHPLFAQRLRQAARRGAKVHSLHAVHDDWLMPMGAALTAAPSQWLSAMADVAAAVAQARGIPAPLPAQATPQAQAVAASLMGAGDKAILLGNAAATHPQSEELLGLARWIAQQCGATAGFLCEAANTVGAQWVGAWPLQGGLHAQQMLQQPPRALIVLHAEPGVEAAHAPAARRSWEHCDLVVAMTPFANADVPGADVLLPVATFAETSGSFVNAQGGVQSFQGVVPAPGQTRPAWKVLRVLGNLLGVPGFDADSSEAVLQQALQGQMNLPESLHAQGVLPTSASLAAGGAGGLERVADVPIYATDALVRRSPALQATRDAKPPQVSVGSTLWRQWGLQPGARVRVASAEAAVELTACLDATLAEGTVRLCTGHAATAALGPSWHPVSVHAIATQPAPAQEVVA